MTVLDKLNSFPPFMCRLVARKSNGRLPMSVSEIAIASGLPRTTVAEYALRTNWDGLPVDSAVKFALACGVNHLNIRRQVDLLRRRKMTFLGKGQPAQRAMFQRLFRLKPSGPVVSP